MLIKYIIGMKKLMLHESCTFFFQWKPPDIINAQKVLELSYLLVYLLFFCKKPRVFIRNIVKNKRKHRNYCQITT